MSDIPTSVPVQEPALAASAPFATSSEPQTAPVAAAGQASASSDGNENSTIGTTVTSTDAPAPFQTGTPANEDILPSGTGATGHADLAAPSASSEELAAGGPTTAAATPHEVVQEPKPIPTTPAPATEPIVESIEKAQRSTTNGHGHTKGDQTEPAVAAAPSAATEPAAESPSASATETIAESGSVVDKVVDVAEGVKDAVVDKFEQVEEFVVDTVSNGEPTTGDKRPLDGAEAQQKTAESEGMSVDTPEKAEPLSEATPADPAPTAEAEPAAETGEPPVKKAKKTAPEKTAVAPTRRSSRSTRSTASLAE
ncbi:BZ3500_MvSof-1268-A1-R1_Chr2-1g04477 [Microbotryum saponariae]|uniref:BZ3500_MvSof-1268-A1-R1_Chr2-1g04477 protein n=1 Tax=Microbotryum saponariae TaxID=289078 RepID=A0A2X0M310_9BASI|nr:BZ3500_MvSof-1268-A1-R1_Chr2-1g04477 [Microbotryum saponariae]SCZ91793.1 BZ3501_MvSof-1269-A2-R1_Chr2-1g04133 [Microbotryum saponariae]